MPYGMSGTDAGYAATSCYGAPVLTVPRRTYGTVLDGVRVTWGRLVDFRTLSLRTRSADLSSYAAPTRCLVLTSRMALRPGYNGDAGCYHVRR
eukprot:2228751-Rhodomonas_salina.1